MDQYVIYNEKYHILICRQHGYAIPSDYVGRHFRETHKAIPLAIRRAIIEYTNSCKLSETNKVFISQYDISPIEGLTIIKGVKCEYDGCSKLRGSVDSIIKHCRSAHGWIAEHGAKWREGDFQTFFRGPHCKYLSPKSMN